MPRAKSVGKTYADRLKFGDRDLENPLHDDIMVWLDRNLEYAIRAILPDSWSPGHIDYLRRQTNLAIEWEQRPVFGPTGSRISAGQELFAQWQGLGMPPARPVPDLTIAFKEWEWPIKERGQTTPIGFVDLKTNFEYHQLGVAGLSLESDKPPRLFFDMTLSGREEGPLPYWKIDGPIDGAVYFEAKTTIKLGELIRQVQFYRSILDSSYPHAWFAVVSPDDRYVDILREQHIEFVKYDPKVQMKLPLS